MSPAAEQAAAEDIDESVADSVQVVQALLESPEAALDLDLDEAKMRAYTQALCKHADKLDEALLRMQRLTSLFSVRKTSPGVGSLSASVAGVRLLHA